MSRSLVALKIDVDTDQGTRDGVPKLVRILTDRNVPATYLFSLGPDNTGKAIRRIFRPGFLKKVTRTRVGSMYSWRTLVSGTLLPAPHIGKRQEYVMKGVRDRGFECGIHCYDHFRWQDYVQSMNLEETRREFGKAVAEFRRIFGESPHAAGAPGWQANERTFQVYDEFGLLYGSDTRGRYPFFPEIGERVFKTLQLPTTLPTLDELLGRPEFPEHCIPGYLCQKLRTDFPNILTIHAEIEGQSKSDLFKDILDKLIQAGAQFEDMKTLAMESKRGSAPPANTVEDGVIDGRSGVVARQQLIESNCATSFWDLNSNSV